MVALRTSSFVSIANEVQPCKNVVLNKNQLTLIFCNDCCLRCAGGYVFYHWINIGQWRRKWEVDTVLEPQLQSAFKQFWKLYLSLCSRIGWVVWNHPKRNICTFYIFTQIKQEWPLCNGPFHSGHHKKRTFFQVSWEKPLMRPGKRVQSKFCSNSFTLQFVRINYHSLVLSV